MMTLNNNYIDLDIFYAVTIWEDEGGFVLETDENIAFYTIK
jgi:hypothetical protein